MQRFTIQVENDHAIKLLHELESLHLLKIIPTSEPKRTTTTHSIMKNAGIWEDRELDAKELRRKAWKKLKRNTYCISSLYLPTPPKPTTLYKSLSQS